MTYYRKGDLRPARRQAAPEGEHVKERAGVTSDLAEEREDSFHTWSMSRLFP